MTIFVVLMDTMKFCRWRFMWFTKKLYKDLFSLSSNHHNVARRTKLKPKKSSWQILVSKQAKQQISAILIGLITICSLITASVSLVSNSTTAGECIHMTMDPKCSLTKMSTHSIDVRCDTMLH